MNNFSEPIQALRVRELPIGNWLYEMKFDGYRALAFKTGAEVRLLSRNRTLFNDKSQVATTARFIRPDFAGKLLTTREVLDEEEAMIKIAEAGEGAYPEFGNDGEWQYTTPPCSE